MNVLIYCLCGAFFALVAYVNWKTRGRKLTEEQEETRFYFQP